MNWTILKSAGFITSFITAVSGLLVAQGVVLSGSTVDHVLGYVVAILGAVGGHHLAASVAASKGA
jgi:hypothetical protein